MATTEDADTGDGDTYKIPSTDEYQKETREVREAYLPDMGFTLPVTHAPPGRIMSAMEKYGLAGLFGANEFDAESAVNDDGEVTINTFMRREILPHIVAERTNKDVFHWDDDNTADDPDVDDFDVSELTAEDLGALIQGIMSGGEEIDENQLDKFQ